MSETFITLGRDNPKGQPLEVLLRQIANELRVKNLYIGNDASAVAQRVQGNNREIIQELERLASVQIASMLALEGVRKEHSPHGPYRIGEVEIAELVRPPEGAEPGSLHHLIDDRTGASLCMRWLEQDDAWVFVPFRVLVDQPPSQDLGSPVRLSTAFYRYLGPHEVELNELHRS